MPDIYLYPVEAGVPDIVLRNPAVAWAPAAQQPAQPARLFGLLGWAEAVPRRRGKQRVIEEAVPDMAAILQDDDEVLML